MQVVKYSIAGIFIGALAGMAIVLAIAILGCVGELCTCFIGENNCVGDCTRGIDQLPASTFIYGGIIGAVLGFLIGMATGVSKQKAQILHIQSNQVEDEHRNQENFAGTIRETLLKCSEMPNESVKIRTGLSKTHETMMAHQRETDKHLHVLQSEIRQLIEKGQGGTPKGGSAQ